MTGVLIRHGLAHMGNGGIGQLLLWSLREPRRRHMLVRSARGLSATTVRTCVVAARNTMCPSASLSLNTTIVLVDARFQAWPIHPLEIPEAQAATGEPPSAAARLHKSPIWAWLLDDGDSKQSLS